MHKLTKYLIESGVLKTPTIIEAFDQCPRENFMIQEYQDYSMEDTPFPIGYGQTISQPWTVAFMLEHLEPKEGQKILDIGAGSGWQSALLAKIIGKKGKLYAIEIIPELAQFCKENLARLKIKNVEVLCTDGSKGLPKFAPFDRIIVAAAAPVVPKPLQDQLKINGKLFLPVSAPDGDQELILLEKESEEHYQKTEFPNFVFVPLKGKYGQNY